MRSRKSASRLFLGTFLEFMSCMDKSESVKIVIPREVGAMLRAYSMASSSAWKLLMDSDDEPAVLCTELSLKYTPHPVLDLPWTLLKEPFVQMGMVPSERTMKCVGSNSTGIMLYGFEVLSIVLARL